jgi:hypothetical protein
MSQPIGMFLVKTLEGPTLYVEATRVLSIIEVPRAEGRSACRLNFTDGTHKECDEPAHAVAQRYTTLVQAHRIARFTDPIEAPRASGPFLDEFAITNGREIGLP